MTLNKTAKKTLRIFLWILGSIIGLLLIIVLLIQIPGVQNFLKNKAVTFIEDKIETPVHIDNLEIGFPKKVILEGFYFEDQQQDTLLYGQRLALDIDLFKLISGDINIKSIELGETQAYIKRNKDSIFNFDYIIEAFATQPKDTTASSTISLGTIDLDQIQFRFEDEITKTNLNIDLGHMDTRVTNFDLEKMDFSIPEFNIDNLALNVEQTQLENQMITVPIQDSIAAKEESAPININLGTIDLSNIDITFNSEQSKLNTRIAFDKLHLEINDFNFPEQRAVVDNFNVENLNGNVVLLPNEQVKQTKDSIVSSTTPALPWDFRVSKTSLSDINFQFEDENSKPVDRGIDYGDLDLNQMNLELNDLIVNNDTVSGAIESFNMNEKSGLKVTSLHTNFLYGTENSYLKDLFLETPNSVIRDKIILGYPSLETLQQDPGEIKLDATLVESRIAFQDILLLVPDLRNTNPFASNPNAVLLIDGSITGKLNDLKISNFSASGIGNTSLAASGTIKGLPDVENARFNLNISEVQTTAQDIKQFVPPGTIPSNITLPERLSLKGQFTGSISLTNFDVGRTIQNDSIGEISLKANVNGTGLDPKTANANISGELIKAEYNSYTYQDLSFDGSIANGEFNVDAMMQDPNLDFDLNASGSFQNEYPSVNLTANVNNADLDTLNLYGAPLSVQGNINADFETLDPDYLNGKLSMNNIVINNGKRKFPLDTITIVSTATADSSSLVLSSQLVDAQIKGKYKLTQIGPALTQSISKYYEISPSADTITTDKQNFDFKIQVKNDIYLTDINPDIILQDNIDIFGNYASVNDSIVLHAEIPKMKYLGYEISDANLNIQPDGNALDYELTIDDVNNTSIKLYNTNLSGTIEDDVVNYDLRIDDSTGKPQYEVAGNLENSADNTIISLDSKNLMLNYENWNIPQDNQLTITSTGIQASNFNLSNGTSAIKINSENSDPNSPLNVDFKDFKIETVSAMISKDTLYAGGTVNGEVQVSNMFTNPLVNSDLNIENFSFKKDTVGDVKLQINSETETLLNTKVVITGHGNDVNLTGTYNTAGGELDMDLDIQNLNVKSVQGFSFGAISKSTGSVAGQFNIKGTVAEPEILGDLKFDNVGFTVNQLNSAFHTMNDKISFTREGLDMHTFTLFDEDNNKLAIQGTVATTSYSNFNFDLNLTAQNFHAVNSTADDNDFYYGDLYLNTDLQIGGTMTAPVVNGTIHINDDTDFTIVLPQADPSIADREGIVEFVDEQSLLEAQTKQMKVQLSNAELEGMDVSVNIEITEESLLTIVLDEANGDYLDLKGNAELNAGIDPSGKTSLTGRYEVVSGAYELSFNFIKRRFDIEKGSYILWTGEPTTADINITAIYTSETAPIDLLDNQLSGVTGGARNIYKQKLPFQTKLNLKGELLEPVISFDIILPEGNYNVSSDVINNTRAKLAQLREQPSELNKQVFALLLLNRFIGENPFASEAGGATAGSLARQSVSKILSQQLNNLAGDLIQGVELDFDLQSSDDYTTGQRENRTDLNVGLSKTLLNERLKVTIGSSFGLEGPANSNQQSNNIAGDLALDYQLSKDGRYLLRAYRKNVYEVALQGQIIETGVSFIITMDYNKFKEIFTGKKKE